MQTFAAPAPITLSLEIPAGRIALIAGDRADATVEIRPADPGKKRDVRAAERTTATEADGALRIHTAEEGGQLTGTSGSLDITVHLPAGSAVAAETAACELTTTGRLGAVSFGGAYRRISLEEASAVHLTAVEGDIEIGRLSGSAQISTTRGDIRIAEAVQGTLALSTQSGDITVDAAAGASASLDAGTTHGRITNSLRNDGDTGLEIRATTSQGDITARSR